MNLVELTEYLVNALVKEPASVTLSESSDDMSTIDVRVAEGEIGAVIGRGGKIANSIRTIVQAAAYTNNQGKVRINIDIKK